VRRIGPLRKQRHILDYEVAAEPRADAARELSLVV